MILSPVVTAKSVAGTLYAPVAIYYAHTGRVPETGPPPVEKTTPPETEPAKPESPGKKQGE